MKFGLSHYEGKWIKGYQLLVCRSCWNVNWDGYGPFHEALLTKHLNDLAIAIPPRNQKGWIPREP